METPIASLIAKLLALIAGASFLVPAWAHEFWVMPDSFTPDVAQPLSLNLYVGEHFQGNPVPFNTNYVRTLRHVWAAGTADLSAMLPATGNSGIQLALDRPGIHLLAIDTHPNFLLLPADKFADYLKLEGLDDIIELRRATHSESTPGRERYRRHVKTIVRMGKADEDRSATASTHQQLEILPLSGAEGDAFSLRIVFEDQALPRVLVKAWHKFRGQTLVLSERSDQNGVVRFKLPMDGVWMFSAVHMRAVKDVPDVDWDSYWANLTLQHEKARPLP